MNARKEMSTKLLTMFGLKWLVYLVIFLSLSIGFSLK